MVVLALHGAMMALGVTDSEAETLEAVRAVVGPSVPVGAILDLHGIVTPRMVESGAVLIGVREYSHIDYRPRVEELYAMLSGVAGSGAPLATYLRSVLILSLSETTEEPMRGFVASLAEAERAPGIRSVTVRHGVPWSDGTDFGAGVLIVSEAGTKDVERIAEDLAAGFVAAASHSSVDRLTVEDAIDAALAIPSAPGPVVIADTSDNPGGGAGCDSTFVLGAMIERSCRNAALGMVWDPQVARIAADAGVGARLPLRLGGKVGPCSGDQIDLEVEVIGIRADARQRFFRETPKAPLGLAVGLGAGGVEIVVNSIRQQVFSPDCFTDLGIDVVNKDIVVVKSSQHFRACFDPVARATLYRDAPGTLSTDLARMRYQHVRLTRTGTAFTVERATARARGTAPSR